MSRRLIEHLLGEHRKIEAVMAELESLLKAQQDKSRWAAEHGAAFARVQGRLSEALIRHVEKEEEVLFPALENFLPRDTGPLVVLRGEHHDIVAHLERMQAAGQALGQGKSQLRDDFLGHARAALQVLRDHIYKEDRVMYPMVQRFLSPQREAHLLRQMEALSSGKNQSARADPDR